MLLDKAEEIAGNLEGLIADADDMRLELDALAATTFPNSGGITPITPTIKRALDLTSRTRDQHTPAMLASHRERWMRLFTSLLADADAPDA